MLRHLMTSTSPFAAMILREGEGTGGGGAAVAGAQPPPPAGGGGGGGEPWYKPFALDGEAVTFLEGKKTPDMKTAMKSWMEADKLIRERNPLPRPEKGKEAEWGGWQELGWEPDAAKYTFDEVKDLPAGVQFNQALDDKVREAAHKHRVPLAAARAIRQEMVDFQKQAMEGQIAEAAKASEKLETDLRTEWGKDYDVNSELARRAMRAFGVAAEDAGELERVVGAPRLVKMFHQIGLSIGDQKLPSGGGDGGLGALSPEAAKAERLRLEGDREWMKVFSNPRDPQHEAFKARRQQLIRIEAKGSR